MNKAVFGPIEYLAIRSFSDNFTFRRTRLYTKPKKQRGVMKYYCQHFHRKQTIRTLVLSISLVAVMTFTSQAVSAANLKGTEAARQLQDAFTAVAAKASRSVVVITNLQVRSRGPNVQQLPPEFRFFSGYRNNVTTRKKGEKRSRLGAVLVLLLISAAISLQTTT